MSMLVQDTRGRFDTSGEFFPIKDEAMDSEDTIRWVAEQPWCDGQVGCYGLSYMGLTALASLSSVGRLPMLKAVFPAFACSELYPLVFYNGVLSLDLVWHTHTCEGEEGIDARRDTECEKS